MEKNPNDRYATAQELADDLRRFQEQKPIKARRATMTQRVRKWGQRHKGAVRVGLVCLVLAVLGLGCGTFLIWRAERQAKENYLQARSAVQLMLTRVAARQLGVVSAKDVRRQLLEDAVTFYTRLLDSDPRDAQTYLERGQVYRMLGKKDEELADYEKAVELAPKKAEYRVYPTWHLFHKGGGRENGERALAHIQRALELEPDNLWYHAWLALVYTHADLNEPGKARTELTRIGQLFRMKQIGKQGKADADADLSAETYHIISMVHRALKELDQAVDNAHIAVKMNPSIYRYRGNLVSSLNDLGKQDEALAVLDQAVAAENSPNEIVAMMDYETPLSVFEMRAEIYLKKKMDVAALEALNVAIEQAGAGASAYPKRALLHFRLGQYGEALADVRRAVELSPDDLNILREIPFDDVAYCPDARLREGLLALVEKPIPANSEAPGTYARRAWIYSVFGEFQKAKADAAKACALAEQKPNENTYRNLADGFRTAELWDEAITCYRKGLDLNPRQVGFLNGLGLALFEKRLFDEAVPWFRKRIELEPGNPMGHGNLAVCFGEMGLWNQAVASFRKAIELDPTIALLHSNLAWLLIDCPDPKIRDCAQAVTLAQKAVELGPRQDVGLNHWPWFWRALAEVHYEVGDTKAALAVLEEARAPKYGSYSARAYAFRAGLYSKLGHPEKAKAEVAKALELVARRRNPLGCVALAWLLATSRDPKLHDHAQAVTLAKKAVELLPDAAICWNTLGVAHYRAGEWKAAITALEKSISLGKGGDSFDWFFLAMAHWRLDEKGKARKWYDQAFAGMEKNELGMGQRETLRRFRAEAAALLGEPELAPPPELVKEAKDSPTPPAPKDPRP
jgi:tetratricopeptide (TPR) repeat protein